MTDVERPADVAPTSPRGIRIDDAARRAAADPRVQVRSTSRTARGGKRRARKRKRHTVAKVVVSTLVTLGLVSGLAVAYMYRQLNGNLTVVDLNGQMLNDRPDVVEVEGPKDPVNILVMGTDTRDCAGCDVDGLTGGGDRSDTTILIHLSADRKRAYGVSIPRDSLVDRPDCLDEDGDVIPGGTRRMWNEAYAVGGPACTMAQFEENTHIKVDHYVTVNFAGFQNMVDAVGGVEVCIPETFDDRAHGIYLKKGTRKISGKQALAYVRIRHIGDGSDIGRVKRQQAFIGAMAERVLSSNTLANPVKVYNFLAAATKSLQLDVKLSGLVDLALQFKNIGMDKIKFITIPFVYGTGSEAGRVVWTPEADDVWRKIRNDRPLSAQLTKDAIKVDHLPGQTQSADPTPGDDASDDPSGSADEPSSGAGSSASGSPSGQASASDDATVESNGRTEEENRALEAAGLCT